ncbi:hypothetical protein GWI33_012805, partial [Rhynchophorus ferrugineus]
ARHLDPRPGKTVKPASRRKDFDWSSSSGLPHHRRRLAAAGLPECDDGRSSNETL